MKITPEEDSLIDIIDESQKHIWGNECNSHRLAQAIIAAGWVHRPHSVDLQARLDSALYENAQLRQALDEARTKNIPNHLWSSRCDEGCCL